jgi:hypothetical protein
MHVPSWLEDKEAYYKAWRLISLGVTEIVIYKEEQTRYLCRIKTSAGRAVITIDDPKDPVITDLIDDIKNGLGLWDTFTQALREEGLTPEQHWRRSKKANLLREVRRKRALVGPLGSPRGQGCKGLLALKGARIVNVGFVRNNEIEGGLAIDYAKKGSSDVARMVLGFTELGMWVEWT